jgi:hypothetical protein
VRDRGEGGGQEEIVRRQFDDDLDVGIPAHTVTHTAVCRAAGRTARGRAGQSQTSEKTRRQQATAARTHARIAEPLRCVAGDWRAAAAGCLGVLPRCGGRREKGGPKIFSEKMNPIATRTS